MKILISNDDGVFAPGIRFLREALAPLAEVYVVAPDRNRSGASNSLTLHSPLHVKEVEPKVISVEGTPTDCVHIALTGLLDVDFDMVVSGINAGYNVGDDVLYSGTVAAAMEGRSCGYPAIAISLGSAEHEMKHFETAAWAIKNIINHVIENPLPKNAILNVNVPDVTIDKIGGFDVTRLGTRHLAERVIKQKDPRGHDIYWVGPPGPEEDAGPGTDFYSINKNRISMTPLQIDMTNYQSFDQITSWVKGLNSNNQ